MSNYFNSRFTRKSTNSVVLDIASEDTYIEDIETTGNTLAIDTGNNHNGQNSSIVSINISRSNVVYPKEIIKTANKLALSVNCSCFGDDTKYLALFIDVLNSFLADALEFKFNFLLSTLPIHLNKGEDRYELPSNFHTQSNLFMNKGCCLYGNNHQRFTFQPYEVWSETTEYYTYTINGYNLYIRVPEADHKNESKEGDLRFEYYYIPSMPESVNDGIYWLPSNPIIVQYLVGLMREKIDEKINYNFPDKQKLWKSIMAFTTGKNNVNSNKKINKKHFTFKKF